LLKKSNRDGGISGTVVDIRLLLSVALKTAASGIILCHNHPSGNLQPSAQDKEITQKIIAASKLLDITILDHLIVIVSPENSFYSFTDEGFINF
jgi:DNA repair protein RadC